MYIFHQYSKSQAVGPVRHEPGSQGSGAGAGGALRCGIGSAHRPSLAHHPPRPRRQRCRQPYDGQDLTPLRLYVMLCAVTCGTVIMIQLASENRTKNRILLRLIIIQKYAHFLF